MATLLELVSSGALTRYDPELSAREMEDRSIYMLPRAVAWASDKLPTLESVWQIEESPIMQVDGMLHSFCVGRSLAFSEDFHCLRPVSEGVWELKTADIRLFGWFYKRDCFIWSAACLTELVKESDLYRGFVNQTANDRESLDLNPPKFVSGESPNDVVSAWH